MSVKSLGKPIAQGHSAEIYAWDESRILKLFRDWFLPDWVEHEARIARAVHSAGLPVPAVGEIMEINGRLGLIYERVEGLSLWQTIGKKLWTLFRSARLLAELHADMHDRSALPELPSQRERLGNNIRAAQILPPDLKLAALRALDKMPDGDRLCHGDFNLGNVLMTSRGPIIIDWILATRGNPLADVARSSVLLGARAARVPWPKRAIIRQIQTTYVRRYFQLRPGEQEQFKAWQPIIAAAWLNGNTTALQPWLLAIAGAGLSRSD